MAINVQNFVKLANFYNQMMMMMSAICVEKGAVALENYVGRYFAADTLEFIAEYGRRLKENKKNQLSPEIINLIDRFDAQYNKVKSLTTPTQKPLYEMTLEEFEKFMNI